METNELPNSTEDEHIFNSLSSAASILEAQSANELKTPDITELLRGESKDHTI
jgi:hypothetical protein